MGEQYYRKIADLVIADFQLKKFVNMILNI